MPLHPGNKSDAADPSTMAGAMADAFIEYWPRFNPDVPFENAFPDETFESLRLFFVAISRGVVQHLQENPDAFVLNVVQSDHQHSNDGVHSHIGAGANGSHTHSGGNHTHEASVTEIRTSNGSDINESI